MVEGADAGIDDDYVAGCPITPELARQIADLADLPWSDGKVTDGAMRALGWRDNDVIETINGFVTGQGHVVYSDHDGFYMPFCHYYWVGGEVWTTDEWGALPGWSSQKGAGREEFDGHVDAAVDRFAELLGPPQCDVRTEGRATAIGPYSWRYAAWRRGGNALVIGQVPEGFSLYQDEEAVVYIGALAEDAPFPEAAEFRDFLAP
ncbi:hypothetical protein GCM10023322_53410 [Rugosimonospora acidiphila]|uniref:SUKH-3 immunity protein n=2 Tax=Rugosimonospora acidiphila TaxID=556531 RepID=A0ABP9SB40_9ACTN